MNILVIGNGFDLAHGLPTRYTDFLEFVKVVKKILKRYEAGRGGINWRNINPQIKKLIGDFWNTEKSKLYYRREEWNYLVDDNLWIDHFLYEYMYKKENWIDFENEVMHMIQRMERNEDIIEEKNKTFKKNISEDIRLDYEDKIDEDKIDEVFITFESVINVMLEYWNRFIRAFEIYLAEYVEKIDIEIASQDIKDILYKMNQDKDEKENYILSFNYTHTIKRAYIEKYKDLNYLIKNIDYIHGEADIQNTVRTNNMVLGINEYLGKKRRNKDTEFIEFKKYFQRIYKQTGSEYKRWVEIIREQMKEIEDKIKKQYPVQIPYNKIPNKFRNQLFIFGHSLDVTDKDILKDLILNDNVYTTIYYHNKYTMGQQIANLVKVIGQDELIRRTGGSTKTIEFKLQQPMVPIDN